jgi:methyl-accepting chemotaxis protein
MRWLIRLIQRTQLQLRWKLLGGFLIASFVLLLALGVALTGLFNATSSLDIIEESNQRSQTVRQFETAQLQLTNSALDYIWSGNLARLNDYELAKRQFERNLNSFKPRPLQEATYDNLKKETVSLLQILDQIIQYQDNTNRVEEAPTLWRTQGSRQAASIRVLLQDLNEQEIQEVETLYRGIRGQSKGSVLLVSLLTVSALVAAVGLALLFTAALVEPVQYLRKRLADLATGDLTQPVLIHNRDELGELGVTYNSTLDGLRHLVQQLHNQSQLVAVATQELNFQARTQVAGSSQQTSAIVEATISLQELNQTAYSIAALATETNSSVALSLRQGRAVSDYARTMTHAQEQGRLTVARTVSSIHILKEKIEAIEEQQQILVNQSAVIERVIALIDSVSRETHLLALNASIEAAGAGVAGSRFGVIATEIKLLADRCMTATKEIRASLTDIVKGVNRAGILSREGLEEAEVAVEQTAQSDSSLLRLAGLSQKVEQTAEEIVEYITQAATLSTNIGMATEEQQSASQQILETMLQIEAVTVQMLNNVRQGENATGQLGLTAYELERAADAFKLAASASASASAAVAKPAKVP